MLVQKLPSLPSHALVSYVALTCKGAVLNPLLPVSRDVHACSRPEARSAPSRMARLLLQCKIASNETSTIGFNQDARVRNGRVSIEGLLIEGGANVEVSG